MLMASLSDKDEVIGHIDSSLVEAEAYFLTICTHGRQLTLGQIENGQMILNDRGKLVKEEWLRLAVSLQNVELEAFVVMPNHFHGIFWLKKEVPATAISDNSPHSPDRTVEDVNSVEKVIQSFKAVVTERAQRLLDNSDPPFWQPSYHAHLIRQKKALPSLRKYIQDNPAGWSQDSLNPAVFDPSCPIEPPPILG